MSLYESIAAGIERQIRQGTLRAGDKLPSVRKLSAAQSVSISTVTQAYLQLESRGLVVAKPQSGFYVQAADASAAHPSTADGKTSTYSCDVSVPRVAVSELLAILLTAAVDPSVVQFASACPSPELFPTRRLNSILRQQARRMPLHSSGYEFPPGSPELRRQLARRAMSWGCRLAADEIVTTSGGMEAINLCLRAVAGPGDTIALESPTYHGVLQSIASLGMRALEIPCDRREGLDIEALARSLAETSVAACLVIPSFHNPTGALMPEPSKRRLAELAGARRLPVIEVDPFGDLVHDLSARERPKAIKAFDRDGWVLLCSSFSKTLAPGFRIGWTAPGRFQAAVERLKFSSTVGTPSLPQMTIAAYLENGAYDRHLRRLRRACAEQTARVVETVRRNFPIGTRVESPRGGFLLWVELPEGGDATALHRLALAEKISFLPGTVFSGGGGYERCLRLNCGNLWTPRIERALVTLGELAARKMPADGCPPRA